jgi:hypothetical protein
MENTRNATEQALIARGIDSDTARKLRAAKHTLSSLKQGGETHLREFGVSESVITAFLAGDRPSIPPNILRAVLYENRWTCCVCRDTERPIVVHHINEWAKSHDHSKKNLAVLCTHHHGEAHAKCGLEMSLTAARLKQQKVEWETYCKQIDLRLSLNKSDLKRNTWYYFNQLRIYELAKSLGIRFHLLPGYADLLALGSCNKDGALLKKIPKKGYMYDETDRIPLYDYVSEMYFSVIRKIGLLNISDHLDKSFVPQLVEGDVILVQGLHNFTPLKRAKNAPEVSEVWRKTNRVRVGCQINLGEATSNSAWCNWLRGQHNVATILLVRKIFREDGIVNVQGTALAIRDPDDGLKKRSYLQRLAESGVILRHQRDDGEIDDEEPWNDTPDEPEEPEEL